MAKKVNEMANLKEDNAITTFEMETHENYGSLIEKVKGTAAKDLDDSNRDVTPAMREAMVFAFITGLSDLHGENVLWHKGKPYFIDADNALNKARLDFTTNEIARNQSGFIKYSNTADSVLNKIKNQPGEVDSKIMKALLGESVSEMEPVVDAVENAFKGKSGRVVPICTDTWAKNLKLYIKLPEGKENIKYTRWWLINDLPNAVSEGDEKEPGLKGETGVAQSGGSFDKTKEKKQIKADFDKGQIPFYNYEYDTGHVIHNGQKIWHGQPLSKAIGILYKKFPNQKDT